MRLGRPGTDVLPTPDLLGQFKTLTHFLIKQVRGLKHTFGMHVVGLGTLQSQQGVFHRCGQRRQVADGLQRIAKHLQGNMVDLPVYLGINRAEAARADPAHPQRPGFGRRGDLTRSDNVEQQTCILDVVGDGPDMVEARRQREYAFERHPGKGRLEADHPAQGCRNPDRAAGVGTQRQGHHAAGDGRRAAGAGAAGYATAVPRVARRTLQRAVAGRAVGEFVGQGLADNHRPGLAQALYALRITTWLMPFEMRRAIGGDVVEGVDIVLDCHRYALQRPQVNALGKQLVGLAGLGQGYGGINLGKGIEDRVQPLNAVQGSLGQLDACQAARTQAFSQRNNRLAAKISSMGRFHQAHANNSIKQRRE